jgi:outer membrane receptor protein involved in Fe transport
LGKRGWKYFGGFFQDDWKVTTKLTLNLGLRWEYTFPQVGGAEIDGKLAGYSNFEPDIPNPGAGGRLGAFAFSGSGPGRTGRDTMYDGYRRAWSPRIGMAYQWRTGGVVRAYIG